MKTKVEMRDGIVAMLFILAIAITALFALHYTTPKGQEPFNWWLVMNALLIVLALASFKIVGPKEIGAIIFFGRPIKNVGSGPHFVLWPFYSLAKETALVIQQQFPGKPEEIFDGSDCESPPPGKVRAIHVTHIGDNNSDDPLTRSMTTSILLVCSFRLTDLARFLTIVGSLDEAKRQIRDMMVRTASNELVNRNVREAMLKKEEISSAIHSAVKGFVIDWGITIRDAYLEKIIISKTLSQSLKEVPISELNAQVKVIQSEATRKSTEIIARGDASKISLVGTAEAEIIQLTGMARADAEKFMLEARAVGYKRIADELGISEKQVILAMETMKEALQNAKYSFVAGSGGLAETLNILPAIQQAMGKIEEG